MAPFKITELDHIVLNVSDIERSLSFYTQYWAKGRAYRRI